MQNLKPLRLSVLFFSHWRVKGLLSKGIALNVDIKEPEIYVYMGIHAFFLPGDFTGWVSEGVNILKGRSSAA